MKILKGNNSGFTFVEVVLVIAIFGILLGLSAMYYNSTQVRTDIHTQAANIVHYLRLSQSNAASGLNNQDHGIHFESGSYTTFKGSSYVQNDPNNFVMDLPTTMILNNINLNGGGSNIIFIKSTGETANYGTISLTSAQINKTIPITITEVGTINY